MIAGLFFVLATSASEPKPEAPRFVVLVGRADPERIAAADRVLRAQLSPFSDTAGVEMELVSKDGSSAELTRQLDLAQQVANERAARAVFWFDVVAPRRLFIWIRESGGARILVREIPNRGAADSRGEGSEAILTVLALMIRSVVEGVLEADAHGLDALSMLGEASFEQVVAPAVVTPESHESAPVSNHVIAEDPAGAVSGHAEHATSVPAAPILAAPEPMAPEPMDASTVTLSTEAEVGTSVYARNVVVKEGAVALSARLWSWAILAAYRPTSPVEIDHPALSFRMVRHPIQLGVRYLFPLGEFEVGMGLLGSLAFESRAVTPRSSELVATARSRWSASVLPHLLASYRFSWQWAAFVALGAEVPADNPALGIEAEGRREVVVRPWSIRPFAHLGCAYAFGHVLEAPAP